MYSHIETLHGCVRVCTCAQLVCYVMVSASLNAKVLVPQARHFFLWGMWQKSLAHETTKMHGVVMMLTPMKPGKMFDVITNDENQKQRACGSKRVKEVMRLNSSSFTLVERVLSVVSHLFIIISISSAAC